MDVTIAQPCEGCGDRIVPSDVLVRGDTVIDLSEDRYTLVTRVIGRSRARDHGYRFARICGGCWSRGFRLDLPPPSDEVA